MADSVSYIDILAEYAAAVKKSVDGLTPAEKQQACFNAILSGRRVEPFASWNDWGDLVLSVYAPGRETLNQMASRCTDK